MIKLTCSLNITIPSTVNIIWFHNGVVIGNTTTLVIGNPQQSDIAAGVYRCVFIDTDGGYQLRRTIRLVIRGTLAQP